MYVIMLFSPLSKAGDPGNINSKIRCFEVA